MSQTNIIEGYGKCWYCGLYHSYSAEMCKDMMNKPHKITDAVEILKRRYNPSEEDLEEARKSNNLDDHADNVKRLVLALGEKWHIPLKYKVKEDGQLIDDAQCSCGIMFISDDNLFRHIERRNPSLLHPDEVFDLLRKNLVDEKYRNFILYLCIDDIRCETSPLYSITNFIAKYIVSPPTELIKKANEFLEQMKGEGNE